MDIVINDNFSNEKIQIATDIVRGNILISDFNEAMAVKLGYAEVDIRFWNFSWAEVMNMCNFIVKIYGISTTNP